MSKLNQQEIKRLKKRYGNWALITGATSGIGRELALQLGKAGFNVVLTGRRESLLKTLATQLFDDYKVEAIPIAGDLSKVLEVEQLLEGTKHLSLGVVILNAGYGTSGPLMNADLEQELNMLDLNCRSLLMMSHYFAKKMAAQQKGAIVLLSSMVAFQGVPNAAHYAATKAYVQSLGEALAAELKPKGVDVLCAAPGPVSSGFSERANMQMGKALHPEAVGVPIIKAIGKQTTVLPGFLTKFLVYSLSLLPRWGKVAVMGKVMGGFTQHQSK